MTEYCGLCGQFVEVVSDREVWGIGRPIDDGFDLVCDYCVHEKLKFGKARQGGCLYCDDEATYELRSYTVKMSTSGHHFYPNRDNRPIVCEEHFHELDESDEEDIMSIEDVLDRGTQIEVPDIPMPEAIGQEESQHLEYKETYQYNVYTDEQDKSLKSKTTKEVAAFGNSEGGTVVIGVRDNDKTVTGLDRDYDSMNQDWDGFALQVNDVIRSDIGDVFTASCVSVDRYQVDGADVCAIHVDPSPAPLFVGTDDFYVRQGSSSQPLSLEDTVEYISTHWES